MRNPQINAAFSRQGKTNHSTDGNAACLTIGSSSDCRERLHEEAEATVEQDKFGQGGFLRRSPLKEQRLLLGRAEDIKARRRLSAFGSKSRLIAKYSNVARVLVSSPSLKEFPVDRRGLS
ncbi:hypothetical protein LMTR3_12685 [Bradyrhizobium sp. LMTR 3]|nr:hypothetical protein LMTR3_12685 [Bradyrhizobium sp. LMTR 3]